MSDAAALLAAIRAAPDDDAPRLIYADWLEEHGQPARAEFIRVQCELARNDSATLRQREAELLAEHHDAFAGPLAAPGLRFQFNRGFIASLGHTGVFVDFHRQLRVMYSLRFYPDGVVIQDGRPIGQPEDMIVGFRREDPVYWPGTYSFALDEHPASIQIEFDDPRSGINTHYRGSLEGSFMLLESRANEGRWYRARQYKHVPIPGFDSFQVSPQDAV